MRKIATAAIALLLAGCAAPAAQETTGGTPPAQVATVAPATTPTETPKPLDLAGHWKQTNSKASDAWMEATVGESTIEVNLISDNGDTQSLYWAGTFDAPTGPGTSYEWDSTNDKSRTEGSLLASTADTKTFTFADGVLSWEVSMLGTTTRVKAERAGN